jgi:hypothetical protein
MPASLHPRHNAIAELDAQIARAEAIRSRYVRDFKAALPGARRTQTLLRVAIAEERVDRLRRSRETLLSGRSGAEEHPGTRRHPRRG